MSKNIKVGIIGSQFVSHIHTISLKPCSAAEVFAVASPTPGNAQKFAAKHGIPRHFTDYKKLLAMPEVDMIVVGAPNDLHCAIALDAAAAGKHVVMEKPLCLNLAEADRMIDACRKAKVKLMYAEELCFTPKYVRLKQLLDSGALGEPTLVKQLEKHDGPHAPHFWDVERFRRRRDHGHGLSRNRILPLDPWPPGDEIGVCPDGHSRSQRQTDGDDNALIILEFANGVVALAEESWTKMGGMDDRAEIHGSKGVAYADLHHGNAIETYSLEGYDYAVEKAGSTRGWSFTVYEEEWNYGFPQEMAHFVDCVQNDKQPLVTGEDGRAVLEAIFAAYESARTGRKVELPFKTDAKKTA